jgi:DNA-binding response OmpR family regulator
MNNKKGNILIIEDHEAVRVLLGMTLKQEFEVITKKDGLEGWAWLSMGKIPDLIMLDMQMPRLNGLDFLRQLRKSGIFRHIPVLLVSANDSIEEKAESFDLGIVDFVSKPFNPKTLKEKVERVLSLRRPL